MSSTSGRPLAVGRLQHQPLAAVAVAEDGESREPMQFRT
jgi:hypothetical protein